MAASVAVIMSVTASAGVYNWARYNLNFETPDGGYIPYSTSSYVEIHWEDMLFTTQVFVKDKDHKKKVYEENLQRKAFGYNMYDIETVKFKVKGFDSYAIEGTMPDGSRAIIADLVAKKQDIVVEITINYLLGNREIAEDIIKSFAINKDKKPAERKKKKQKVQKKDDADKQRQQQQRSTPSGPVYEI